MKTAIITAAGKGERFGAKKQFAMLGNKLVLDHSMEFFFSLGFKIVLSVPKEDIEFAQKRYSFAQVVEGGTERMHSVYNALKLVEGDIVLIHDGVRPILDKAKTLMVWETTSKSNASILAIRCSDTLKYVENGKTKFTINRNNVYCAQTPQGFRVDLLKKAFEKAFSENIVFSDEASLWEHYISNVEIVEGFRHNIKITTKEDLKIAGCLLNDNIL